MFTALGLDYIYEPDGNDIASLIKVFTKVRDSHRPVVVHICTQKGKGYPLAEINKEQWHWCMPFDRETGKPLFDFSGESYTQIAKDYILDKAKEDNRVVIVTPNMPNSFGLSQQDRESLGKQYVDVGIAEEQAVAMASGIAKRGGRPIVITNTTFMQRTYDQMSQDVCINNSPVTFLLNYSSFDGLTDVTHLGIYGIPMFSNIPNLVIVAPSSKEELISALDYSVSQTERPIMILLPGNEVYSRPIKMGIENINKFEVTETGSEVAIIALGDFYQKGEELANMLKTKLNIRPTLINPRFASGTDTALLDSLIDNHKLVITLEDGIKEGGFGYKVASFLADKDILVKNYGLEKEFYDRYDPEELLKELKMDNDSIIEYIKGILNI